LFLGSIIRIGDRVRLRVRGSSAVKKLPDKFSHLAKAKQIKQRRSVWRGPCLRCGGVIGPAGGDGAVKAVGQADDKIRVRTAALANDGDLLTEQGMVRVSDSHP
jgi:hypothetical protein